MSRIKSLLLFSAVLLAIQAPLASATTTYAVGTCKPTLPSFATITAALTASPLPDTVEICPGTYKEQVTVSHPVSLEGILSGNSGQPLIAPPSGGLVAKATDDFGDSLAVQLWVKDVTGDVNISNITVDGSGNKVSSSSFIVGVFYQNSPGTVNHLTTRFQKGNTRGVGVWLEGGSAHPSVTVENSNLHDFDDVGIEVENNTSSSELTATVQGNDLSGGAFGINLEGGITVAVAGNLVSGSSKAGILTGEPDKGVSGSVSGNTIVSSPQAIVAGADGVSITSNRIFDSTGSGITVATSVASIQTNTIIQSNSAIDFQCVAGSNVHSNLIQGSVNGLVNVPTAAVTTNTYFNVSTIRTGGC